MRALDEATIRGGVDSKVLMERAAKGALAVLDRDFDTSCVLIACGNGNNGGDGLAMARFLADAGKQCRVFYLGRCNDAGEPDVAAMSVECARQYKLLPPAVRVDTEPDGRGVTAVVDAVLGIGLARPVEGRIRTGLEALKALGNSGGRA